MVIISVNLNLLTSKISQLSCFNSLRRDPKFTLSRSGESEGHNSEFYRKTGQNQFRVIIVNKKRDFYISDFCICGKELFHIKENLKKKNKLCAIKLCAIHG